MLISHYTVIKTNNTQYMVSLLFYMHLAHWMWSN